ncbi:hypothetical protein BOC45_34190 [Burkholderia pseudomallei]|nr:hypothetical protein BOC45_34190 [Burkholderia pseudomallei]
MAGVTNTGYGQRGRSGRAARRRRIAPPVVFPLYDNTRESDSGTVTNKGKPFLTRRKVIRSRENAACRARRAHPRRSRGALLGRLTLDL